MFESYKVGSLFSERAKGHQEGAIFDISDTGCNLILYFKSPSQKEIDSVKNGTMKIGFYTEKELILMLFKIGDMNWIDSPYSVHLSKELTKIQDIPEGKGLSLNMYLIDTYTGVLKSIRLLGLPTNFSCKLKVAIEKQKGIPFDNFDIRLNEVYAKYSAKELIKFADIVSKV